MPTLTRGRYAARLAESDEDVPELLDTRELRMPIADDERINVGDTAHFITRYKPEHLQRILERTDLSDLDKLQLKTSRLDDLLPVQVPTFHAIVELHVTLQSVEVHRFLMWL